MGIRATARIGRYCARRSRNRCLYFKKALELPRGLQREHSLVSTEHCHSCARSRSRAPHEKVPILRHWNKGFEQGLLGFPTYSRFAIDTGENTTGLFARRGSREFVRAFSTVILVLEGARSRPRQGSRGQERGSRASREELFSPTKNLESSRQRKSLFRTIPVEKSRLK